MIEIELNGKKTKAQSGQNIIQLTDSLGVDVPRFCYHKHLSVAANCRMCLVDVEGSPKPQPACSTPLNAGMKIWTCNDKAKAAQKAVMEFLLINHPLDCPICDQGGECELQDVAFEYGTDVSRFSEAKRVVVDKDIGPLIQTDMTRCIHCTRCIRFGTEIGGFTEMGATGRGEDLTIEPFLKRSIVSELSGNMIDVCPVGALTSKPFRYELRSWEMQAKPSIARHDNIGSHIWAQTFGDEIKRIVPRENEAINQTWIANRERFSYQGLNSDTRFLVPKIKLEDQWQNVSWNVALEFATKGISKILNTQYGQAFGMLTSNNCSLEDYYLLAKLAKALEINNLDYRLGQKDLTPTKYLPSTSSLESLSSAGYILVIGGNTRFEQPLLNHRLRQASLAGAKVVMLNSAVFDYNFRVETTLPTPAAQFGVQLGKILVGLIRLSKQQVPANLASIETDSASEKIAKQLSSGNSHIVLGEHLANLANYNKCLELVQHISGLSNSRVFNASMANNSIAAYMANIVPSPSGKSPLLAEGLKGHILVDVYPSYDCDDLAKFELCLKHSDFILAFNSFKDKTIDKYADVVLPIAHFYESAGTFIGASGSEQFVAAAAKLPAEAKPMWKIIRVLAEMLQLKGFAYNSIDQIRTKSKELLSASASQQSNLEDLIIDVPSGVCIIDRMNASCSDALLRASKSLLEDANSKWHYAKMNQQLATNLKLNPNDTYRGVPVMIDNKVASDSVLIYRRDSREIG